MTRSLYKWILIALTLAISAEAAAADQCKGFKFEQVRSLSLQDFGRLAQQKVVTGEPGSVVFIPFDEEDHPQQDKLRALGLIFARVGDLGETPVGGYVWISKGASYKNYDVAKKPASVSITFHLGGAQHCAIPQLTFELKQMGRVYVNDAFVDAVK